MFDGAASNSIVSSWAPVGSHQLLSRFTVSTEDTDITRMVNIRNQYQCMITVNMSRSVSYYESGLWHGLGFRESCQDLLGFVPLIPGRARQRILDIAATQFEDGSAYHQYQPLTKRGNMDVGSGFNDDPLWLIAAVCAYLRESGDMRSWMKPLHLTTTKPGPDLCWSTCAAALAIQPRIKGPTACRSSPVPTGTTA